MFGNLLNNSVRWMGRDVTYLIGKKKSVLKKVGRKWSVKKKSVVKKSVKRDYI